MAELLGVTVGMISHIETGRRNMSPQNANKWSVLLGVSREALRPDIFGTTKQ